MEVTLPHVDYDTSNALFALVTEYCHSQEGESHYRKVKPSLDPSQPWIHIVTPGTTSPPQGWKLHISATIASAEAVLHHALPVLLNEKVNFKVAASLSILDYLNQGNAGLTQIGKFMTVYPTDDAQAVRLAVALDQTLRQQQLHAPGVPSDRLLSPGSLVHYRYGNFNGLFMQTTIGEVVPALTMPSGDVVPDRRQSVYTPLDWVVDPFIVAGVAPELPAKKLLLNERYLLLSCLHRGQHGAVYLSIDSVEKRICVLKQARRDTIVDVQGRDAGMSLRYEASVLTILASDARFPQLYDIFEQDDDVYLVLEDLGGETLEHNVLGCAGQGCPIPDKQSIAWGRELAAALAVVHEQGFIYRDLKSPNVMVTPEGHLRVLDFESAYNMTAHNKPFRQGTRGYLSPQQDAGQVPAVTDDIYSVGALLYFIATGSEPSQAPHPFQLLDRPLEWLNPEIGPGLAAVIVRCLDPRLEHRFPSMVALDEALAHIDTKATRQPPPFGSIDIEPRDMMQSRFRTDAHRLGDTFCEVAQPEEDGVVWASTHPFGSGTRSRDINMGSSGVVLALADLVAAFGEPKHRTTLTKGAHQLTRVSVVEGTSLPGFYVGEAGIGAALLRAGQVLSNDEFIIAAVERGQWIAQQPYTSPDIFNGTAGRLLFHLLLWDETGEPEHLSHALSAGDSLLAMAEERGEGGLCWRIPAGYESLSGNAYLGYAHGAAGIADALLDLFEATKQTRFLSAAQATCRWLMRLAIPSLSDATGLTWPSLEGGPINGVTWCHGATGIGRCLLHAAQCEALPEVNEFATRAARMVARGACSISPTQCHGLAGNIDFLLDFYQATGETAYLIEAMSLARLLESFRMEHAGQLVWSSESPTIVTPDYMVGYAGVAVCLLRLSAPTSYPRQLSRRGFRYGRTPDLALKDIVSVPPVRYPQADREQYWFQPLHREKYTHENLKCQIKMYQAKRKDFSNG